MNSKDPKVVQALDHLNILQLNPMQEAAIVAMQGDLALERILNYL